jgi:predicted DNA-binding transcriptional regulator AlpA
MKRSALQSAPLANDDVLLRRPEMARLAGNVSVDTIKRWARVGICPPPVRVGPRLAAQWRSVWISWLAKRDATGNPA